MATESGIRINTVSKTFRSGLLRSKVCAVAELNLDVPRGSVVAFVGPNGAGKTTTIYLLLGILRPDTGNMTLLDHGPGDVAIRRRIGYQSEIFSTYRYRTPVAALKFYGKLSGMSTSQLRERVPAILERVGLHDAARRKIGTFSKGMNQRLGLAQALLHEPDLLILDEPTTGLDPEGRKMVGDIILEEKERGATVFLSSHILSDVERFCDGVVMIRRGQTVFSESMDDLKRDGDAWEVEAIGWNESVASSLNGFDVRVETPDKAFISCTAESKNALLRALLDLPVEIGTVRSKARSLEDIYMKLMGEDASNA